MRDSIFGRMTGFLVVATLLAANGSALAATLVLKDGAVIHGEIKSLQDDVYTVKTDSLGTLQVQKKDVRSIDHSVGDAQATSLDSSTHPSATNAASINGSSPEPAALQAVQSQLTQNPALLSLIEGLQSDPEIQGILNDPEIMSAISAGNYAPLMNHPKIIALTRNANVRAVIEQAK